MTMTLSPLRSKTSTRLPPPTSSSSADDGTAIINPVTLTSDKKTPTLLVEVLVKLGILTAQDIAALSHRNARMTTLPQRVEALLQQPPSRRRDLSVAVTLEANLTRPSALPPTPIPPLSSPLSTPLATSPADGIANSHRRRQPLTDFLERYRYDHCLEMVALLNSYHRDKLVQMLGQPVSPTNTKLCKLIALLVQKNYVPRLRHEILSTLVTYVTLSADMAAWHHDDGMTPPPTDKYVAILTKFGQALLSREV